MALKGRSNRGTGRSSSFGKRQKADDDFRKKKKEGRSSSRDSEGGERKSFSSAPRSSSGPRRGAGGSSYAGGKRNFSAGPRGEKRPYRKDEGSSTGRGERKSFGEKRSYGSGEKRSYGGGEKRSFGGGEKRSYGGGEKRSYGSGEKRSYGGGEKRSYGSGEKRTYGGGGEKRPYGGGEKRSYGGGEKRSFGGGEKKPFTRPRKSYDEGDKKPFDKDEKKPFRKSFDEGDKKPFDKDENKPFRKSFEDKPSEKRASKKRPYESRSFVESKVESHRDRVETPEKGETEATADGLIRLNKFISNSGVCSRREADELIKMGVITVNGTTITEMGYKVKPTDDVRHDGRKLTAEKPVYILLNKPKGFITTTEDPQERNTVMQLVAGACKERVYPVGRLDRNTTGLLLLTNDGDLTDKLTHPSFNAKKIYKVELDKPLTKEDFQKIVDGVHLEEGKAMVDDLAIVSDDSKTVGIELHIGWNHVVRRIFDALEYSVMKLDRVVYAGLDKKDLKRGQWRFLKTDEIVRLKHFK
jgi:23S rRNA pseudouridine2605 synthase